MTKKGEATVPKKEEETGLVKPDQELTKVPAYIQEAVDMGGAGLENLDTQKDMTLARLGLCQSMTPQRKKGDPSHIPGLEEGQFFNTVTSANYGDELMVVPLLVFKTRLRFKRQELGGGLLCQSRDYIHGIGEPGIDCARCSLKEFQNNVKPECNELYNYAVMILPQDDSLPGMDSIAVVSLKSTSIRVAKTWNSLMNFRRVNGRPVPSFLGLYKLGRAEQKNAAGQSWFQHTVHNAEWVSDRVYKVAKEAYEVIKQMNESGKLDIKGGDEEDFIEGEVVHDEHSEV